MTRYFRQIKHYYDTDDNRSLIRTQRVYVKSSDISVQLSPITNLLLQRQITTTIKVDKFPENIRTLVTFVANTDNQTGWSRLQMNLPYNPNDPNLEAHIKEIFQYSGVICADYIGEKL